MAIIGKIREKSWLLVGLVGLAMFAFILTDYNKGMFGGKEQIGYGTIDGEVIDPKLYEEASKNYQQADQQVRPSRRCLPEPLQPVGAGAASGEHPKGDGRWQLCAQTH